MNSFKGAKKVFDFTLAQMLKAKSTKVVLLIMFLCSLLSVPIKAYIDKSKEDKNTIADEINIDNLYYFNNTDYKDIDFKTSLQDDSHTKKAKLVECENKDLESKKELVEKDEKNSLILTIDKETDKYTIKSFRHSKGSITEKEATYIATLLQTTFNTVKMSKINIEKDVLADLSKAVKSDNVTYTNELSDKADANNDKKFDSALYNTLYTFTTIIFFIIIFTSAQTASGIATDKSSRVTEYLMTSIKPINLLTGKVLAAFCFNIIQMGGIGLCLFVSNLFTKQYISDKTFLSDIFTNKVLPNLNIGYILLGVVTTLLGLIFYSMLAGLCASTVSKIEDLQSALAPYNIICIASFYAVLFLVILKLAENINAPLNSTQTFITVFPFTAPFLLPSMALCGKISLTLSLVGILMLIVACIAIMNFTTKIYVALIMYNGNKVSPRDFIKIYKGGMKND